MMEKIIYGIKCEVSFAVCDARGVEFGVFNEYSTLDEAQKSLRNRGTGIIQVGIYPKIDGTTLYPFWGKDELSAVKTFIEMYLLK
jgi:hypothetical protein